jgi:MFS family permease
LTAPSRAEIGSGASPPWAPLAGIIAAVSVYAIAQGLTYPLLSFVLARQGYSPALIGLSAAMTPIGFICCAPLVPRIAHRFGPVRTVLTSATLGATILFLIGLTREATLFWFPLRFMLGAAVLPLYIVSEVWIIELSPAAIRGRILGAYTSIISAGFAIGPFTLALVGTQGWRPFAVGVAAFAGCGCCLLVTRRRLPGGKPEERPISVRSFLPRAPVMLLAVFVTALLEQVSLSLLPVYGLSHGIREAEMSALIGVLIAGNIALQVPLGLAAERWSARAMLAATAAAAALGALLIPPLIETPLIWPLIFLWGAASFGIYTVTLVSFGKQFTGSALVAGNAAFALMWGIGGISGPSVTGAIMNAVGVEALPFVLAFVCVVLVAVRLARR